jgi:hypothetical protein
VHRLCRRKSAGSALLNAGISRDFHSVTAARCLLSRPNSQSRQVRTLARKLDQTPSSCRDHATARVGARSTHAELDIAPLLRSKGVGLAPRYVVLPLLSLTFAQSFLATKSSFLLNRLRSFTTPYGLGVAKCEGEVINEIPGYFSDQQILALGPPSCSGEFDGGRRGTVAPRYQGDLNTKD